MASSVEPGESDSQLSESGEVDLVDFMHFGMIFGALNFRFASSDAKPLTMLKNWTFYVSSCGTIKFEHVENSLHIINIE